MFFENSSDVFVIFSKVYSMYGSRRSQVFGGKVVLKRFLKFTRKHLRPRQFLSLANILFVVCESPKSFNFHIYVQIMCIILCTFSL